MLLDASDWQGKNLISPDGLQVTRQLLIYISAKLHAKITPYLKLLRSSGLLIHVLFKTITAEEIEPSARPSIYPNSVPSRHFRNVGQHCKDKSPESYHHGSPMDSQYSFFKKKADKMKTIITTILGCVLVAVAGGLSFIYSGIYDVSATTPDSALVAWAVHKVSDTSVGARLEKNHPPVGYDKQEMIAAGGKLFSENCTVCHGGPGLTQTSIAKGLNPTPPDLFRATREPDPAENFQFIKYGIKMTAMPGFGPSYSDEQIWSLVALLNKLPGISASDYASLTTGH